LFCHNFSATWLVQDSTTFFHYKSILW